MHPTICSKKKHYKRTPVILIFIIKQTMRGLL
jgi:hypothetical protein